MEDDYTIVERFVSDYLALLDSRLDGLAMLLGASDDEATKLCVLSLETTSAMLGATEVVSAAQAVREGVECDSDEAAEAAFGQLRQAVRALQSSLGGLGFSAAPSSVPADA